MSFYYSLPLRSVSLGGPLAFFFHQLQNDTSPPSQLHSSTITSVSHYDMHSLCMLALTRLVKTAHCTGKTNAKVSTPIDIKSPPSSSSSSLSTMSHSAPQKSQYLAVPANEECRGATDPGIGFVDRPLTSDTDEGITIIRPESTPCKKSYWTWKDMLPSTTVRPKDLNVFAPTSL